MSLVLGFSVLEKFESVVFNCVSRGPLLSNRISHRDPICRCRGESAR